MNKSNNASPRPVSPYPGRRMGSPRMPAGNASPKGRNDKSPLP